MDAELLDDITDILVLPKPQALAKLQEKKREGKLNSEDLEILIPEFLSPTRTESDGHKIPLHTQLARARFADDGVSCCEAKGTPPQRRSWSVADRRREPIRRGSPEWLAAKGPLGGSWALKSSLVTCSDIGDENEEEAAAAAPETKWGRAERGRTSRQRRAARLRCARGQPSSLRSSWSVARDGDDSMVAFEGAKEAVNEMVEEPLDTVEESGDKAEELVEEIEETAEKVEEPVDMGEKPVEKADESVESVEESGGKVQEPVVMVAHKSDSQLNDSDSEKDREVPPSSRVTTLGHWLGAIMWRC